MNGLKNMMDENIKSHLAFDRVIDPETLDNAAIAEAGLLIASAYSSLVDQGFPEETIGRAMLSATVNMYDTFDLLPLLPSILRTLAARIDFDLLNVIPQ